MAGGKGKAQGKGLGKGGKKGEDGIPLPEIRKVRFCFCFAVSSFPLGWNVAALISEQIQVQHFKANEGVPCFHILRHIHGQVSTLYDTLRHA